MENVSRFSSSFLLGKVVISGSKSTGSAYPALTVTSTKDKFSLNQKALAIMELVEGMNVVMLDLNKGQQVTDNPNERFYLTKGWDKGKGNMEGAKIGKNGNFSYAGVYSAIVMNDPTISEASVKDMEKAGKGIIRTNNAGTDKEKEAFIGLQKITFKVERLVQKAEVEGEADTTEFKVAEGITQPIYALTEMDTIKHTPREAEAEVAADAVE